jgi:hypothetical protein
MKNSLRPVCLVLFFFLVSFLSGCAAKKSQVDIGIGVISEKEAVALINTKTALRHDAYGLIIDIDNEPCGYGMYTYVLFGSRVYENGSTLPDEVVQRYQSLLAAIESSTATAATLEEANASRSQTNLFCIPAMSSSKRPILANYNFDVAFKFRSVAMGGSVSMDRHLARFSTAPGPFLISSLHPLNQIRSPEPMLLADLSRHNPEAMREVISAYKERLNLSVPERVEIFEPFLLKLLTLILDADQNVMLVREAVAAWLPTQGAP